MAWRDRSVPDTVETSLRHNAEFGHSRSQRMGVGRVSKNFANVRTLPLWDGHACPIRNTHRPHICY